jgi:hypothetical protein
MQARPSASRYRMDIHLITRPHRPELRAVATSSLFTLARTHLDEAERVRRRGRCCTSLLY